ncbi:dynactin p62 [Atractiella rhizophila]|nr:dynactin p62 [Atractiella rhizophila]
MHPTVLYHCSCLSPIPPPSKPPQLTVQHHPLSALFFCEECDAIRCNRCVTCEVSCYYCPNCLFEVPNASVRGDKNRCARNCFQCPQCLNTLSVVASDPVHEARPGGVDLAYLMSPASSVGESPYYLSCNHCRWNSKEVGISFEKATGLSVQLQKSEANAPDLLEFDRLKDHFDAYIRSSLSSLQASGHTSNLTPSTSSNPVVSAASAAYHNSILKDSRYGSLLGAARRIGGGTKDERKEEVEGYKKMFEREGDEESEKVKWIRDVKDVDLVSRLQGRWGETWDQPLRTSNLRPQRIPLLSKRMKRCPACTHILIKPDQKAQSVKYRIKLVASNYLPSISISRRALPIIGSRLSSASAASTIRRSQRSAVSRAAGEGEGEEPLRPQRSYTFELAFTNPLYEPISVRLAIAKPKEGEFAALSLPCPSFGIEAYAEVWEYEDETVTLGGGEMEEEGKKKKRGLIEKKGNRTTVALEVTPGKEALGVLNMNMLVTYVYQADDSPSDADDPPSARASKDFSVSKGKEDDDTKSFAFWTMVTLGVVQPRNEERMRRPQSALFNPKEAVPQTPVTPALQAVQE